MGSGSACRRMVLRVALTVAVAALGTSALIAPADAKPADHVARHDAARTAADQQKVVDYWTADRMKRAIPIEKKYGKTVAAGQQRAQVGEASPEVPQPRLGKVFFHEGAYDYVCSGTATSSGNGDVVTTAGHCVNEGPGAFVTNFAFVPAYNNGAAPYGTWTAKTLL